MPVIWHLFQAAAAGSEMKGEEDWVLLAAAAFQPRFWGLGRSLG
jgi:hypothetical protein